MDTEDFVIEYQERSASEHELAVECSERGWNDAAKAAQAQTAEYSRVIRHEMGIELIQDRVWTPSDDASPYEEPAPDACCPVCVQRLKQDGADQCRRCLRHIAYHALEHGSSREAARGELAEWLFGAC